MRSGAQQVDLLRVLQRRQQSRYRDGEFWVNHLRCKLGEGSEDEAAILQLRVRNLQRSLVDDLAVEEEDIQINDARAPTLAAHALAAHRGFDGLESLQQLVSRAIGFNLDDRIDEPRFGITQWLTFIQ